LFLDNLSLNYSMVRIRRKTKQIFIENSLAFGGGWKQNITFVDLLLFGVKIKNLHKYYITYRNEFVYCSNGEFVYLSNIKNEKE
jgi:hypothetical protein